MSIKDFEKLDKPVDNESSKKLKKELIENIEFEDINYYLAHMDELVNLYEQSYFEYTNAKLKYDLRKSDYQVSINWTKENDHRIANGLPKVTNQDQRNAVIDLKLKPLQVKLKFYEFKYNFFKKLFNFISDNFELLHEGS